MGLNMTWKTQIIGSCTSCDSPVAKHMRYVDEDGARGITLEAGTKQTGFWAICTNPGCTNNEGQGTLPSRPRDEHFRV
jgi:hypothetical protein